MENPYDIRYLTFSCYKRLPLFNNNRIKDRFAFHLENARTWCGFNLYAWVLMPEHVHLLLWPRIPPWPVSKVLARFKHDVSTEVLGRWRALKARVLTRLIDASGSTHFWQPGGGHDRNIWSTEEFDEKFNYIHFNPVARGLVERPEDWAWSSARWYKGEREGPVSLSPLPAQRPSASTGP